MGKTHAPAFFGYPQVHDNDTERAARAGLAILDAIAKLNEQRLEGRPQARIMSYSPKCPEIEGLNGGAG